MFNDTREPLAEVASQLLVVLLDQNSEQAPIAIAETSAEEGVLEQTPEVHCSNLFISQYKSQHLLPNFFQLSAQENLFCNYLSRIHREEV